MVSNKKLAKKAVSLLPSLGVHCWPCSLSVAQQRDLEVLLSVSFGFENQGQRFLLHGSHRNANAWTDVGVVRGTEFREFDAVLLSRYSEYYLT